MRAGSESMKQSGGGHGSLARHHGNRARPVATAAGIRIYQHLRAPAAGGPVGRAHEKFDADGRLVHQATRDSLATFLQHFTDLIALHAMAAASITT